LSQAGADISRKADTVCGQEYYISENATSNSGVPQVETQPSST